jgi:hypothetical protein
MGVTNTRVAASDATQFHEFCYSLMQRFARQGVSMLSYLKDDGSIKRTISVIKPGLTSKFRDLDVLG